MIVVFYCLCAFLLLSMLVFSLLVQLRDAHDFGEFARKIAFCFVSFGYNWWCDVVDCLSISFFTTKYVFVILLHFMTLLAIVIEAHTHTLTQSWTHACCNYYVSLQYKLAAQFLFIFSFVCCFYFIFLSLLLLLHLYFFCLHFLCVCVCVARFTHRLSA